MKKFYQNKGIKKVISEPIYKISNFFSKTKKSKKHVGQKLNKTTFKKEI